MGVQPVQFDLERWIASGRLVGRFQLKDQRHQGLGDEAAAVKAEIPAIVRAVAKAVQGWVCSGHGLRLSFAVKLYQLLIPVREKIDRLAASAESFPRKSPLRAKSRGNP